MSHKNFYHGQLVMEDEIDDAFEYAEEAGETAAYDAGAAQAETTDTPDNTVFGGIIEGGVVSRQGSNDYVSITPCVARDHLGNRIPLTTTATVKFTHTGQTEEAAISLATAVENAASIVSSCPDGSLIVCSLFIVFDELLSDTRVDATGTSLYFDVADSFHFDLQIGTSFTEPLGAAPPRASLASSKILLADLVLQNSGGALSVVEDGVCCSSEDWDTLATTRSESLYASNDGRRGDLVAFDNNTDFPYFHDEDYDIRKGSVKAALYELVKTLQRDVAAAGSPAGTEVIGGGAVTGSGRQYPSGVPAGYTLSASSLRAQLTGLLDIGNSKATISDDLIKPRTDGRTYSPELMADGVDKQLLKYLLNVGGAIQSNPWLTMDHRGVPHSGVILNEDFFYQDFTKQGIWSSSGGGTVTAQSTDADSTGGVIKILSANDTTLISTYGFWAPGVSGRWGAFHVSMKAVASPASTSEIGLFDVGSNAAVSIRMTFGTSPDKVLLYVSDTTGGGAALSASAATPVTDTWYTIKVWVTGSTTAVLQVNAGTPVMATLASGSFGTNNKWQLKIMSQYTTGNIATHVDRICVCDCASRFTR